MIIIAFSWLILLIFLIPTGIAVKSILKINTDDIYIPIFIGVFIECIGLSICSFFFKIGLIVFIFNFFIIIGLSIWKSLEIKDSLKETFNNLKSLSTTSKLTILTIFIFSLFKCTQYPFIIDNESYYIQTIKWINEYGYIKGLANLHIYFGQTSPFHVLQAGLNFNFFTDRSNDLNGFILNISLIYFITEFEKRYKINGEIHWIGFGIVFNILLFQFINSPTPDLSIILFSQILFYYFLDKEDSQSNFKIATLLLLYLIFIKIIVAPFALIILYLINKNKKRFYFFFIFCTIISTILIMKNLIITGYPIYPFDILPLKSDWTIPEKLLKFVVNKTEKAGYFKTSFIRNPSISEKLNSWIHLNGINRIFNIGMLILFALGLLVKKYQTHLKYKILYCILACHFIILLLTSPQYRFFLPEFVFLFVIILNIIFNYFKINFKTIQYFFLIVIIIPFVLTETVNYPNFIKNKLHKKKEKNNWNQILIPKENSKFSYLKFSKIKEGNLIYNSPKENFFFYGTANGPLPCVNQVQINYLKKKYQFKPQLRTSNLADGFYSKKTLNESN